MIAFKVKQTTNVLIFLTNKTGAKHYPELILKIQGFNEGHNNKDSYIFTKKYWGYFLFSQLHLRCVLNEKSLKSCKISRVIFL
jgi:hypothetical protein